MVSMNKKPSRHNKWKCMISVGDNSWIILTKGVINGPGGTTSRTSVTTDPLSRFKPEATKDLSTLQT